MSPLPTDKNPALQKRNTVKFEEPPVFSAFDPDCGRGREKASSFLNKKRSITLKG